MNNLPPPPLPDFADAVNNDTVQDSVIGSLQQNINGNDEVDNVCYDVNSFYAGYADTVMPLYQRTYKISQCFESLPENVKCCVTYAIDSGMTFTESATYYYHILNLDNITNVPAHHRLVDVFSQHRHFYRYCDACRRNNAIHAGWKRVSIVLPHCEANTTGCFRCPLSILKDILRHDGVSKIIPFRLNYDANHNRTYSTPWNSNIYQSYTETVTNGTVVLIDLYSDGTTLAKSGTQSAHFFRVRFSNVRGYSETWTTIGIAPTSAVLPHHLPPAAKRRMKMQLIHRFVYRMFKDLIQASFTGFVLDGQIFTPRIAMYIADQPEERSMLSLKRQGSEMDCTHCSLPSQFPSSAQHQLSDQPIAATDTDTDEDAPSSHRRRSSRKNTNMELSRTCHPRRSVSRTVRYQLSIAQHNRTQNLDSATLSARRRYLMEHSAHEYPPSLASFAGLGSPPHSLYHIVSYDKLHVLDLGLTRQFCDLAHEVIRSSNNLPLTRLMTIVNNRFSDLPPSARLASHRPFRTSKQETQAGLSGKIRRDSVPFLWLCLLGVSTNYPDDDKLVQCALQLNAVNAFLCSGAALSNAQLIHWQEFLFTFCKTMVSLFKVDVSTKLHRTMRHVIDHVTSMGCIRRGSSEENEMIHKEFKCLFTATNKRLEYMGPQLLNHWNNHTVLHGELLDYHSDSDDENSTSDNDVINWNRWMQDKSNAISLIQTLSGSCLLTDMQSQLLCMSGCSAPSWRLLKRACIQPCSPHYNNLMHRSVFGGKSVYGKAHRHDGVKYKFNGRELVGLVDSVFAPTASFYSAQCRLVLIRQLVTVPADPGNEYVVSKYGHIRYAYNLSAQKLVHTVLVDCADLLHPVMVVVDPFWMKQTLGLQARIRDIEDTPQIHQTVRFFLVNGYNIYKRRQRVGEDA